MRFCFYHKNQCIPYFILVFFLWIFFKIFIAFCLFFIWCGKGKYQKRGQLFDARFSRLAACDHWAGIFMNQNFPLKFFQTKVSIQTLNGTANNITTRYTETLLIFYFCNVMLFNEQSNFNCCIYNCNIVLGGGSETQHWGILMFKTCKYIHRCDYPRQKY